VVSEYIERELKENTKRKRVLGVLGVDYVVLREYVS
jgi:hypothetical protein